MRLKWKRLDFNPPQFVKSDSAAMISERLFIKLPETDDISIGIMFFDWMDGLQIIISTPFSNDQIDLKDGNYFVGDIFWCEIPNEIKTIFESKEPCT